MKILEEYPPNFAEIRQYFDVEKYKPVFCYGEILYNPYKHNVPIDIQIHEEAHAKQQTNISPDIWWTHYLLDKDFRQDQEIEAYNVQYRWLKEHIPDSGCKEALREMAENLVKLYNLELSVYQAETLIRKYG